MNIFVLAMLVVGASAPTFEVSFAGKSLQVEPARISAVPFNRVWPGYQRSLDQTRMSAFVGFDVPQGGGELAVRFAGKMPDAAVVRPYSRAQPFRRGDAWRMDIKHAEQFVMEFSNGETLHVFADQPGEGWPAPTKGLTRFGPGEHHPGAIIPKSGETIVIERGATVYGNIVLAGVSNVTVTGRGVLDGSEQQRSDLNYAGSRHLSALGFPPSVAEWGTTPVYAVNCRNIRLDGVTFRDAPRWTMNVQNCDGVVIRNVKIVGMWRYNSDGIDICGSRNVRIEDSFIRSFDDCVIARPPCRNMKMDNCVLWCDWNWNIKVQHSERPSVMEDISFTRIKALSVDAVLAGITTRYGSTNSVIRNVRLEDIEVNAPPDRLKSQYQRTDEQKYRPRPAPGLELLRVDAYALGKPTPNQGDPIPVDESKLRFTYENIEMRDVKVFCAPGRKIEADSPYRIFCTFHAVATGFDAHDIFLSGLPSCTEVVKKIEKGSVENVLLNGGNEDGGRRDPRVRTFVYPKRIVWQTSAKKASDGWPARCAAEKTELLLKRKFGQVCEGAFGSACGTRLVNKGEPVGLILDFGRELHGGVQLGISPGGTAGARLRLRFGESVSEAMSSIGDGKHATNEHALRDFELPVPLFGSIEVGNTGFRFLRIDLVSGGTVGFEFVRAVSLMRPMKAIGSFRSSDERLNKIFETAVRTARLCCQEYLWDGIKRDRLVWAGDLHPEMMTVLNVFGAERVIPDSLDYLAAVTPPDKWMHGMATYTLWWIRNLAAWYRYTGDVESVRRQADYLEKAFAHVASGMKDGQWRAGNFLDWPTRHNQPAATAGTQGLALETARDVAFLADVVGRATLAAKARALAAELARLCPDPHGAKSAAAMLALSGLRRADEMFANVLGQNGHDGVSTFYGYYMLEAMSLAGENQRALDTVRDYWGGMLDVGATSFWEDFNLAWTNNCFRIDELPVTGKKDIHGDYGEFCYPGFRHSLCHGWASGPASWCINRILGIQPVAVGCRRIEVKPFLGDLEWAEGAMALPDGNAVRVRLNKLPDGTVDMKVTAPDWVEVVRACVTDK